MKLLDKVKAGAEQATARAKEGVHDVQAKRELTQTYAELGRRSFELVEDGSLLHPDLDELVAKIRELKAELDEEEAKAKAEAQAEAPAPTQV